MESVTFNSENQQISGNLHIPYEGAPCIILLHGLESNKDCDKWKIFASRLYDEGYACLRFSFRGCGEGIEKSEGQFEDVSLTARIRDYRSALQFLHDTNEIDMQRLGAAGSSFGGMTAIAAQDKRIKAMVIMGSPYKIPRYDKPQIPKKAGEYYLLPSGRRFKESFYEDLRKYDLLKAIRSAPPVLILHGSLDEVVPIEHAQRLYEAAAEPKKFVIIEGADHVFSRTEPLSKAIDLSLEWFKKYV